jgi:hypothetical protein
LIHDDTNGTKTSTTNVVYKEVFNNIWSVSVAYLHNYCFSLYLAHLLLICFDYFMHTNLFKYKLISFIPLQVAYETSFVHPSDIVIVCKFKYMEIIWLCSQVSIYRLKLGYSLTLSHFG